MQLAIAVGTKLLAAGTTAAGAAGAAGSAVASGFGSALTAAKGFLGMSAATSGAAHAGVANIAGAGASAAGASGMLSKMALATSALSAFSSFAGGMADKREAEAQALEARYAANQSILQGVQQGNDVLDGVVDEMARVRVAYARAGLDAFSGTPQAMINRIGRDGEADMEIGRSDALVRYVSQRRSAKALKARGGAAGGIGIVSAAAKAGQAVIDWKARG